jgi:hypothetical protein
MALLDNSGDIILDCVLTEIGRKRMARGQFNINKFALGDDEINYQLYDKNHKSGSAYYDLEILQTPVFQATTQNATINYGLVSYGNPNLFYMPSIVRNTKVPNSMMPKTKIYYLAINDGVTSLALTTAFGGATAGGLRRVLKAGQRSGTAIVLETGLNTAEIAGTSTNRSKYIKSQGLMDTSFNITVDQRYFTNVLGPTAGCVFDNSGGSGEAVIKLTLSNNIPAISSGGRKGYVTARVRSINNNVLRRQNDKIPDTDTSAIAGPRAAALALNFDVKLLTTDDFKRYGKTGQTVAGAAGTYQYIDTTVYVEGSSGVTEQLPIRIIKQE